MLKFIGNRSVEEYVTKEFDLKNIPVSFNDILNDFFLGKINVEEMNKKIDHINKYGGFYDG